MDKKPKSKKKSETLQEDAKQKEEMKEEHTPKKLDELVAKLQEENASVQEEIKSTVIESSKNEKVGDEPQKRAESYVIIPNIRSTLTSQDQSINLNKLSASHTSVDLHNPNIANMFQKNDFLAMARSSIKQPMQSRLSQSNLLD